MSVSYECCVLSCRVLCDGPITRPGVPPTVMCLNVIVKPRKWEPDKLRALLPRTKKNHFSSTYKMHWKWKKYTCSSHLASAQFHPQKTKMLQRLHQRWRDVRDLTKFNSLWEKWRTEFLAGKVRGELIHLETDKRIWGCWLKKTYSRQDPRLGFCVDGNQSSGYMKRRIISTSRIA